MKAVHPHHDSFAFFHGPLVAVSGIGDLLLKKAPLDCRQDPAQRLDAPEILFRFRFHFTGERFHKVRTGQRVRGISRAALVSDDLLAAQGDPDRLLGRQRQHLVHGVGMQRLGAAQYGGQRLQRRAHNIILRLLGGEAAPRRLRMKAHHPGAGVFGPVALFHMARPDPPCGAVLADLFKKVEMSVEKEGEARREIINIEAGLDPRFHIGKAVGQGKGQLLHRGGARFADVVTADADRVPARHLFCRKSEDIGDQPHRRLRREDP